MPTTPLTPFLRAYALLLPILLLVLPQAARANPWTPPDGSNTLNFQYRDYSADRSFPQGTFGTATQPSSSRYLKQELRITGHAALSPHWLVFFDLRAAHIEKIKHRKTLTASGPEDQQLGFARVFDLGRDTAQALALSAILPTGSGTLDPALSTGQHAVEMDYWLWHSFAAAGAPLFLSLSLGPRVFLEGGAPQIRFSGVVGGPFAHRWSWVGSLFVSRTLGPDGGYIPGNTAHNATNYNLLRQGIGVSYRLTHGVRLRLLYEKEVAGEALHAGQRITLGLSLRG
ncbi:hypothetical protein BJI67_08795 [Acidihalobacter aeolianus]|uniref:Transporter n=1 Tax=Acidihalobacter aeolianus TaxID=2792603 RepID=A0A1D8K857_9GAMM|nr:hypothetical protein [Acidihalobacter aeolianus]AOV17143.1 hypothetical protein BJI67_08795 [Acidihalobacter aeolianus]